MKKFFLLLGLVGLSGVAGFLFQKNQILRSEVKGEKAEGSTARPTVAAKDYNSTLGGFLVTDEEICSEKGKPLVYFFGSSTCPHCAWEKPIMNKVAEKFKGVINYHENFDNRDDSEVFLRYSQINPGYVPFLVLGCKYVRVGSGENQGATKEEAEKSEEEALTAILCKLTKNRPKDVCNNLKDKVSSIE